jgi:hypothetical protein
MQEAPTIEPDLRTWDAWQNIHQPFELEWWKEALKGGHSSDPEFSEHWAPMIEFIQPCGVVIDIGCGPRPPFAGSIVIDPLAIEYRKITPTSWWEGITSYVMKAEDFIDDLLHRADVVVCWNCIDHTIGWRTILDNMARYTKRDGRLFLATDFWEPFTGHPGFDKGEFMYEIGRRFRVVEKREPFDRAMALSMVVG